MTNVGAIEQLQRLEPLMRAVGIRALYLFGSAARGNGHDDSDIDLLFEAEPARRFSLLDQARLQTELGDALGRSVDLIEHSALRLPVMKRAECDMVRVF